MASRIGALCLSCLPLLLVVELCSTTFGSGPIATLLVLAVLAGAAFAADPDVPGVSRPGTAGRLAAALLVALGLALFVPQLVPLVASRPATTPAWLGALAPRQWAVLVPFAGAALAGISSARLAGRALAASDARFVCSATALGFLALLTLRLPVQGLAVLPRTAGAEHTLQTAIGCVLLALITPGLPPGARWVLALLPLLAVRVAGLGAWTLDPATRDMLPLAESALGAFVEGRAPYGLHQMQRGSEVPLTYLPGLWGLWGVPRLWGLELRWAGILADAAIAGALWFACAGRPRAQRLGLGLMLAWLASPSVHWNGIYAEPHPWWAVLAWLFAALVRRRTWLAVTLLGLAVITRHFALVLAPFVLIAVARDVGVRVTLWRAGVSGAVFASLLALFVARDPASFWFGTLRWLVEYGPAHQTWFHDKLGFQGTLYRAGHGAWLHPAQAGVVALGVLLAFVTRSRRAVLGLGALTLALFIAFNGIVWDSFWLDSYLAASVLALGGATSGGALHEVPATDQPPREATLAAIGVTLLALPAGYLAFTLARSLDTRGRGAAAALVARAAQSGDVVIDRSDWQLAFVQAAPLAPPPPTPHVAYDWFGPRLGAAAPGSRVWLVARDDRDAQQRSAFALLGRPLADEHAGRYVVLGRELGAPRWTLRDTEGGCRVGLHTAARLPPAGASYAADLGARLLVVAVPRDVAWRKPDVLLDVSVDGSPLGTLRVRNSPTASWTVLDTTARSGSRRVGIGAAPSLCLWLAAY